MAGGEDFNVVQSRVVWRSLSRNELKQLPAVFGRDIAALILLARQSDEILAVVAGNQANGPVVIVVGDAPAGGADDCSPSAPGVAVFQTEQPALGNDIEPTIASCKAIGRRQPIGHKR